MAQPPQDESFLARWSNRKRAEAETPAPEPAPEPPSPPLEDDSISEEELAALPALEEFTPKTDIRPFLRKGVPQAMRKAALRRIWLLNPAIRDHNDPAVDYAWDWNTPGGVPGDGVGPSVERAAEMLRDLVAPRRDAAPENALECNENPDSDGADPDSISAPQYSAAAEPESALDPVPSGAGSAAPAPSKIKEKQSDNDPPMARKRHGGALPD